MKFESIATIKPDPEKSKKAKERVQAQKVALREAKEATIQKIRDDKLEKKAAKEKRKEEAAKKAKKAAAAKKAADKKAADKKANKKKPAKKTAKKTK